MNRNCFDEIPEFTESQYRFLIAWLRTVRVGQRTRVITTGNPPTTADGQWVIKYWGPWLDREHPNPAQPGELRWYVTDGDSDREVAGPDPVEVHGADGQTRYVKPRSRSFIPARVEDNPYYMRTGYVDVLDNLPEPLRSQMRFGDFQATAKDDPYQVMPTAWVVAAQARWKPDGHGGRPVTAAGCDPSRGGVDEFVVAKRHDEWVAPLEKHGAKEAPDGEAGARIVFQSVQAHGKIPVQIDIIGSAGSSVYDFAARIGVWAVAMNANVKSFRRDRSGKLGFVNKRSEWHWRMRELLDPASEQDLALPPDPQLRADLCAARWWPTPRGIQVEPKDDIKARLGRSPDRGEAVIYCCVDEHTVGTLEITTGAPVPDEMLSERERAERERARLAASERTVVDEIAKHGVFWPGSNGNGGMR